MSKTQPLFAKKSSTITKINCCNFSSRPCPAYWWRSQGHLECLHCRIAREIAGVGPPSACGMTYGQPLGRIEHIALLRCTDCDLAILAAFGPRVLELLQSIPDIGRCWYHLDALLAPKANHGLKPQRHRRVGIHYLRQARIIECLGLRDVRDRVRLSISQLFNVRMMLSSPIFCAHHRIALMRFFIVLALPPMPRQRSHVLGTETVRIYMARSEIVQLVCSVREYPCAVGSD